jgi:hypothetical protein
MFFFGDCTCPSLSLGIVTSLFFGKPADERFGHIETAVATAVAAAAVVAAVGPGL